MLFDKARHEVLTENPWNSKVAEREILTILDDVQRSFNKNSCWVTHPLDAESYPNSEPKWAAYAGAAGAVHGLQILQRYNYKVTDLSKYLTHIYANYLEKPDVSAEPGLQIGEIGILMPAILAQPDNRKIADQLIQCMEATLELPFYEITSGQTGMMHVALALFRKTGNNCWKVLYLKGADQLMHNWKQDEESSEWHWQSQVFAMTRHYYGACHGLAGNANILIQGRDLLPAKDVEKIIERTVSTLEISVKTENGKANWPLCTKPNIDKLLVQWCHGAAGIVTALARTPVNENILSEKLDALLIQTAELVWQAGPLVKGSNICHGTAGNGYAFLYLYQRWGDILWLERARQFALHAIKQCQNDRKKYGQGRYTLWTGDVGLAIYLHHCLYPEDVAIPGLDLF